jgi:hypothetical protein
MVLSTEPVDSIGLLGTAAVLEGDGVEAGEVSLRGAMGFLQ